jgi:Gluconate 2-dehydrogenase subunit 3
MQTELARCANERGRNGMRWFTQEEAATADALGGLIVPTGDGTPGFAEIGVLGAPGIESLDRIVNSCTRRQGLYSRGLYAFDQRALILHGRKFAQLEEDDQVKLFKSAQSIHGEWADLAPAGRKAWRRLRAAAHASDGSFFAAMLYPQIRDDCLTVFYTSRVSWTWLKYDGPPMELGYPNLEPRH